MKREIRVDRLHVVFNHFYSHLPLQEGRVRSFYARTMGSASQLMKVMQSADVHKIVVQGGGLYAEPTENPTLICVRWKGRLVFWDKWLEKKTTAYVVSIVSMLDMH